MPLTAILPIRAVTVRLRFLQTCHPPFFHHSTLTSFLFLLGQNRKADYKKNGLWIEATESGRTIFKRGDEYRFTLFCNATAYTFFGELLDCIRRLPQSFPADFNSGSLFKNNLQFIGFVDYFTQLSINRYDQLLPYDSQALEKELVFWQQQKQLVLRFTSPARFKHKQKSDSKRAFISDRGLFQAGDIEQSIFETFDSLLSSIKKICEPETISYQGVTDRLFWTDNIQTLKNDKISPFGGVLGDIILTEPLSDAIPHLPLLILGQYIGIGSRRKNGLGRYRLETQSGQTTTPSRHFTQSYRSRCSRISTLELACLNIGRKHPYIRQFIDYSIDDSDPAIVDPFDDKTLLNSINLHTLANELEEGLYQASILQGVILRKANKHHRPLAIPPLEDRIAQRAVVEILGVDIDKLSTIHSYGYRKGMSRMGARDHILMLNRQGYDWFFEADVEEFFDLVSHQDIENRLYSFFPDEPLVPLILDWIKAPVKFDGKVIQRSAGLPQGSPISPMLANLMLEDFDSDLEAEGMKLIRFADDFVILCKNKQQAKYAAERAEQSLTELGLSFNPEKTNIGEFSDGFDFLGYTFIHGLAIENKRSHAATEKLKYDNIPRASWLAKLLQQQPQLLDELNNTLDKKHRQGDPSPIISTPTKKQNTLPSNELGSTLFVTQPSKIVHQHNGMLEIIDIETKKVISQQHWNDLCTLVIFGRHSISQHCQIMALNNNIAIHYCSVSGKYLGVTTNKKPSQEGADLWLQQMQVYQDEVQTLKLTKTLVAARIHNQIEVVRQRTRHSSSDKKSPVLAMQKMLKATETASNQELLRGYEGQAAALYFAQLAEWIPEEFEFTTRKKRPSPDPFNALLSLGYTILYSHACSVLQIAGLYPWQGFYHQGYGRHMALASDLMEVFRHIVERTALTMLRSGQLKADNFYILQDGSCRLTRDALKIYLTQLSSRMLKPLVDKNHINSMNMHEHLLQQANQLIRHIRDCEQPIKFFMLK